MIRQNGRFSYYMSHMTNSTFSLDRHARALLFAFFFISGACGLIYQVVWLRVLGLIFGNTTFAASTVVASFMAGLGWGALYFGKKTTAARHPVRWYGMLEGGIALYSFATPILWKLIEIVYVQYYRAFEPSFFHFSLLKFLLSFLALLFPTFLMGGTLPVLSKYFVRDGKDIAHSVGLLYAWNTLGAVFGVLASGFFVLYFFGVWQTVYLAGLCNLIIAWICCRHLAQNADRDQAPAPDSVEEPAADKAVVTVSQKAYHAALLVFFAVSGSVSMIYEIAWTRILAIVLGSSVYAFSVMLATYLSGISLGSFLFSKYAQKRPVSLTTFAAFQILTAFFVLLGLNHFDEMPYYFVKLYEMSKGSVWMIETGKFFLCGMVMFLPTLLIGAMFSCFMHIYHHTSSIGKEVGTAYFANTVGSIAGAFSTGFFIIPWIGIQNTLILGVLLNTGTGIAAFLMMSGRRVRTLAAVGLSLALLAVTARGVHSWDKSLITSGAMVKPYQAKGMSREQFRNTMGERETLFYKEGASGTVNVIKMKDNISLAVNGKVDASNGFDAFTQFLLGHLPLFLNPGAKSALIIGLGSGSTAAAVAAHPVEKIDVIEIEKAVVDGARFFPDLNRNVLEDPRVRVIINDGRNYLLMTKQKYDVIISEPSNPWMAGVANLFSYEHYRNLRKKLAPGGVVCQWLHAYSMSKEDLRMIIATFKAVFPEASLWMAYFPDLMLIGREEGGKIDFTEFKRLFEHPEIRRDFEPYGVRTPEGVLSSFWIGNEGLKLISGGARINRDNHPYLEFSAPRYLYHTDTKENFDFLNAFREASDLPVTGMDPPAERNLQFQNSLTYAYIHKKLYAEAQKTLLKAKAIDPQDAVFNLNVGILFYLQEHYKEAAAALLSALEKNPSLGEARHYLGLTYTKGLKWDLAVQELEAAVQLAPENEEYKKSLGEAYFQSRQYDKAAALYDGLIAGKQESFDVLNRLADSVFKTGDLQRQMAVTGLLIGRYKLSVAVYEKLARYFEEQKNFAHASKVYETLIENVPDRPEGYLGLASLYGRAGKNKEAKSMILKAMARSPQVKKDPQLKAILKTL